MSYLGYNKRPKVSNKATVDLGNGLVFDMNQDTLIFPNVRFQPSEEQQGGYPLDFNLVIKHTRGDMATAEDYQNYFRNDNYEDIIVNGLNRGSNDFDLLSTHYFDFNTYLGIYTIANHFNYYGLKEFYDLGGIIKDVNGGFKGNADLEVIELPECTDWAPESFYTTQMPNLRVVKFPKVTKIGDPAGNFNGGGVRAFGAYFTNGINFTFNNALKTANAGAMHADIQYIIDNKNPIITWVD